MKREGATAGSFPTVFIKKVKRPEGWGLWRAYVIGDDHHGTWLFTPRGSAYRGEKDGVVHDLEVGQGNREAGLDVMHLVPGEGWWIANWCHLDGADVVAIDISRPPTFADGGWEYIDLEVDLYKDSAGRNLIADEDEFEDAILAGWINQHEADQARAATSALRSRLVAGDDLLDAEGIFRLRQAQEWHLPPLRDFSRRS